MNHSLFLNNLQLLLSWNWKVICEGLKRLLPTSLHWCRTWSNNRLDNRIDTNNYLQKGTFCLTKTKVSLSLSLCLSTSLSLCLSLSPSLSVSPPLCLSLSPSLPPDDNSNQSSIADSSPVKQENSCSTSPAPEAASRSESSEAKPDQSPDSKRGQTHTHTHTHTADRPLPVLVLPLSLSGPNDDVTLREEELLPLLLSLRFPLKDPKHDGDSNMLVFSSFIHRKTVWLKHKSPNMQMEEDLPGRVNKKHFYIQLVRK